MKLKSNVNTWQRRLLQHWRAKWFIFYEDLKSWVEFREALYQFKKTCKVCELDPDAELDLALKGFSGDVFKYATSTMRVVVTHLLEQHHDQLINREFDVQALNRYRLAYHELEETCERWGYDFQRELQAAHPLVKQIDLDDEHQAQFMPRRIYQRIVTIQRAVRHQFKPAVRLI